MTLDRLCQSLILQTMIDFEVLLIDDGSTDMSGRICDSYAKQDSRFKVFHKSNEGIGSTRQFGIDHASGEYTIHADSDDWVEPDWLEQLYSKAIETGVDMVI
ncbi:MAG: glycosyltransferase, partial [Bacteroidaceae bacterium]|nr:glycosyltransferase [Bacteroidaceae bacterium]